MAKVASLTDSVSESETAAHVQITQTHVQTPAPPPAALTQWRIEYKNAPNYPIAGYGSKVYLNSKQIDSCVVSWGFEMKAQDYARVYVGLIYDKKRIQLTGSDPHFGRPNRIIFDGQELVGIEDYDCRVEGNVPIIEVTLIPSAVEIVQVP